MPRLSQQLLIILLFCLVGCGYHLQKPLVISDHRQAIFIDGDGLLALKLKKQLRSQGTIVSDALSDANSRITLDVICLLYTSPSPRDATLSRMPSSA